MPRLSPRAAPSRTVPRALVLLVAVPLLLAWSGQAVVHGEGYKVVVNSANSAASVPKRILSAMFLKKVAEWSNGIRVAPVDQKEGSPARAAFSEDVHGKSVSAIKSYWGQMIFSGRGVPPPEKGAEAEVLAFVRANPGAVGYVSAAEGALDGVKVLKVADE